MTERTGPVRLSELPAAEARAIFDDFVADQPQRLAEFTAEVRRRDLPADDLDLSLASVDRLMGWMVEDHPRSPGDMPFKPRDDGALSGAPRRAWWEPYHPQWAEALGPYVAWLVSGYADYFAACAVAVSPGSRWAMGRGRNSADYQLPVLQLTGRGEMTYSVPIVAALRWLGGAQYAAGRKPPRKVLEFWLGLDSEHEAQMAALRRPLPDYVVGALDGERFTHVITFDDSVAHGQERRIERLLEGLGAVPNVEAALHEDREIVLVRATGLRVADLEAIVGRIWDSSGGRSHAGAAPDVS